MKVLIAVDESVYSRAALQSVCNRPWPPGSKFKVVTVVEPFHPEYAGWQTTYIPVAAEAQKTLADAAAKLLEEAAGHLIQSVGAENVVSEVAEGYIKERILESAREWNADLIVVGSHGRRGFTKFLLGSVSEAIASHATCSVEIVRIKESVTASSGTSETKKTP
jgi:nucleotide-binding universal stress UspA family protein